MKITIKNCGLTTREAVEAAIESGASLLGFVIHPHSPRHIEPANIPPFVENLPEHVQTVAVLVDPTDETLDAILAHWRPDYWQLHGQEFPERLHQIRMRAGIPMIKAIGIAEETDLGDAMHYAAAADMLLLDTKTHDPDMPGGSGGSFDWRVLHAFRSPLPWLLSGGLQADNVASALAQTGAQMVDVSSGIESSRGMKDVEKIRLFNETVIRWAPNSQ